MISMGYNAKLSISITYIFLIGGSLASIWKNGVKKNPKTGRSYVNLNLILLTIPTMISGSLLGVNCFIYLGYSKEFCIRNDYYASIYCAFCLSDL
jgi:hypothetical protein